MSGERTEKATPKRKSDERKKGNIFQSKEVVTVASLFVMFYALRTMIPIIYRTIATGILESMELAVTLDTINPSDVNVIFQKIMLAFAVTALPMLIICGFVTVVITMVQTRMLVTGEAIQFKMTRLNPLQGFKRMFSVRGLVELLKSLIKIFVVGYIMYSTLKNKIAVLPRLLDMSILQALTFLSETIITVVNNIAGVFIVLAALDYFYQWWEYEKNLRMSKQEIKEEYKQTEGDPQIKGQIRDRQRKQSMQRMMQNVPTADVVIRNPTHYAIAIRYDADIDRAPVVVAKGADKLALRIIAEAEKHDIVVTENRSLARGLYEAVDLEREIPADFYQAVAEVLVFVYELKNKIR